MSLVSKIEYTCLVFVRSILQANLFCLWKSLCCAPLFGLELKLIGVTTEMTTTTWADFWLRGSLQAQVTQTAIKKVTHPTTAFVVTTSEAITTWPSFVNRAATSCESGRALYWEACCSDSLTSATASWPTTVTAGCVCCSSELWVSTLIPKFLIDHPKWFHHFAQQVPRICLTFPGGCLWLYCPNHRSRLSPPSQATSSLCWPISFTCEICVPLLFARSLLYLKFIGSSKAITIVF